MGIATPLSCSQFPRLLLDAAWRLFYLLTILPRLFLVSITFVRPPVVRSSWPRHTLIRCTLVFGILF